jgi:hypothetical protein
MKGKNNNFATTYGKNHAYVPGPGTYKNVESAFDRISKSPTTHKMRRWTGLFQLKNIHLN